MESSSPPPHYLVRFAQTHESFRRAEIEAISRHLGADIEVLEYEPASPFCLIAFRRRHAAARVILNAHRNGDPRDAAAALAAPADLLPPPQKTEQKLLFSETESNDLARRYAWHSILSRGIYELWGSGREDYEALHQNVRSRSGNLWGRYKHGVSFKFSVDSFRNTRSEIEKRAIINEFVYLGFQGKIDLKKPDQEFVVFEQWTSRSSGSNGKPVVSDDELLKLNNGAGAAMEKTREDYEDCGGDDDVGGTLDPRIPRKLKRVFLGRRIALTRRQLIEKHDLKKRPYISTTSMDAELALVTANMALAAPGKLFLDPFVGTGGFMIAAAELGAMTLGSDIDGRSFRGKGHGLEKGVGANFKKYRLQTLFGDCISSDLTNTPLRKLPNGKRWLDGVICDPPYGVREGLKVLGTRKLYSSDPTRQSEPDPSVPLLPYMIDGVPAHTMPGYIAPKKPYSFERMLDDILDFSARTLVDGGRLAFWMPSANLNEDGEEEMTIIPSHPLMPLKHECVQKFNKWSRRLLVYERIPDQLDLIVPPAGGTDLALLSLSNGKTADELNPFRKRYFQAFVEKNI